MFLLGPGSARPVLHDPLRQHRPAACPPDRTITCVEVVMDVC